MTKPIADVATMILVEEVQGAARQASGSVAPQTVNRKVRLNRWIAQ
jgi:hypothetical protein